VANFLLAYGVGIVQSGYEQSPLEQMACNLQRAFDRDSLPDNLIQFIQKKTDKIWRGGGSTDWVIRNTGNPTPVKSNNYL
jgi:hypothetical protein